MYSNLRQSTETYHSLRKHRLDHDHHSEFT